METLINILGWITFIGICSGIVLICIMIIWSTVDDELDEYFRRRDRKRMENEYRSKLTQEK